MTDKQQKEAETKAVADLYLAGKTLQEISAISGMTPDGVLGRLKKAGIARRQKGPAPNLEKFDREMLVELYCNQKLSIYKIGELLNQPGNTIAYQLRLHKIPRRSKKEAWCERARRARDGKKTPR